RVALESTTSASPITNPVNSLLVYDSVTAGDVTPGFYYWDGTTSKWIRFSTGSGSGWSTSGNAGTDTTANFIGTTDARSWVMKTDNTERMKISKFGNVGIGTTNPASSAILDVSSTTKGQLIPRMSSANRDAIVSPATGLQIYNIDCNIEEYYTGSCWVAKGKSLRAPGPITSSGSTIFCAGQTRTYSISPVPGATDYTWTVPAVTSITGQGTTSITVVFDNYSGSVCVTANNACESSSETCINVSINPTPLTPGNITGSITAVPGQTTPVSYSIAAMPGAITYNWTVPPGANITSGTGTTNIVVNYSCNTTAGYVAVSQTAACGTSTPASLAIAVNPLSITAGAAKIGPGTLGGSPTATGGYGTYVYAWSPSTGLSGTSIANPTATACVTNTYTLTVTDINTCSATSSVTVTRNLSASAGGNVNSNVCPNTITIGPAVGTGGTGTYTYSWTPSAGMANSTTATPTPLFGSSSTYTVVITDGGGCTASSSMNFTVSSPLTFNFAGTIQSWTIPAGITTINVKMWGAGGGGAGSGWTYHFPGGGGGYSGGALSVTPSEVLTVIVGEGGKQGSYGSVYTAFGGGGTYCPGTGNDCNYGAGGGGRSAIRRSAADIMTAGGGGGGGQENAGTMGSEQGGAGGGAVAQDGASRTTVGRGRGATTSAGGAGGTGNNNNGTAGTQYLGGYAGSNSYGGGGGGGYYGGGGGGYGGSGPDMGGGGGGSGYAPGGTTTTGSDSTPGNSGDSARGTAGNGGAVGINGSHGIVIVSF
ncbi:MAG: hypothetical protein HGB12_03070, partial [Bacteroidetes bacterium]|nr:hypothetical protein [Bacteroidota bacterium]